jgi:hypothetical protein
MSDVNTEVTSARAEGTMSSARLEAFEAEVAKLKITGGGANPERLGAQWGIGLTIFGFVIAIISFWSALNSSSTLTALRSQIMGAIGIGVTIVGIAIWVRNSITRYLRYWIIRLVYEQREQTEAIVKALRER